MALETSPRTPTRLRLEDYTVGTTTVGQMGTIIRSSNSYDIEENNEAHIRGQFSACLTILVEPYALNADGSLGRKLTEAPYQASIRALSGANDTLLSAATGQFLAVRRKAGPGVKAEGDAEWEQRVADLVAAEEAEGRDCILQGDALENMRHEATVVADEELKHLRAADLLLHRFAARD